MYLRAHSERRGAHTVSDGGTGEQAVVKKSARFRADAARRAAQRHALEKQVVGDNLEFGQYAEPEELLHEEVRRRRPPASTAPAGNAEMASSGARAPAQIPARPARPAKWGRRCRSVSGFARAQEGQVTCGRARRAAARAARKMLGPSRARAAGGGAGSPPGLASSAGSVGQRAGGGAGLPAGGAGLGTAPGGWFGPGGLAGGAGAGWLGVQSMTNAAKMGLVGMIVGAAYGFFKTGAQHKALLVELNPQPSAFDIDDVAGKLFAKLAQFRWVYEEAYVKALQYCDAVFAREKEIVRTRKPNAADLSLVLTFVEAAKGQLILLRERGPTGEIQGQIGVLADEINAVLRDHQARVFHLCAPTR